MDNSSSSKVEAMVVGGGVVARGFGRWMLDGRLSSADTLQRVVGIGRALQEREGDSCKGVGRLGNL